MPHQLPVKIVDFYLAQGRDLPWRASKQAYFVHVSETMLQQTRVETVIGYFERFMRLFPTVFDLASAEESQVLLAWEGLGYYSRAKNLHKAAKMVVSEFEGIYPRDKELLLSLPGVGEYTANAILAFSKDERAIPVDGNVLRLFSRLTGYGDNVLEEKAKKLAESYFLEQMSGSMPSLYCQGLMELGEVICLPRSPKCDFCPLAKMCIALKEGRQDKLPVRIKGNKRRCEEKTALVYAIGDSHGYEFREGEGLLSHLYGFPLLDGQLGLKGVKDHLKEKGLGKCKVSPLCEYKHVFSHVEWRVKAYLIELTSQEGLDLSFLTLEQRRMSFALPTAFRPIETSLKGKKVRKN